VNKVNIFIFLGPPGSGKGTQCGLLHDRLNLSYISTGDLIRNEIAKQTELGKLVQSVVDSGKFIEDSTILNCLRLRLQDMDFNSKRIILLDGIPRNIIQANALLESLGDDIKGIISLEADLNVLIERFEKRFICTKCQRVSSLDKATFHLLSCEFCGSENSFLKRKDDDSSVVLKRFEVYREQTLPLTQYFTDKNLLCNFDALMPVEHIYVQIAHYILEKTHGTA